MDAVQPFFIFIFSPFPPFCFALSQINHIKCCIGGQIKQVDHERGGSGNARVVVRELEVEDKKENVDEATAADSFENADCSRTLDRYDIYLGRERAANALYVSQQPIHSNDTLISLLFLFPFLLLVQPRR